MKKFKSILSIALVGILITSAMGFSVSRHYCMGMLVEENFYSPSEDCGMDMADPCTDSHDGVKKDCCEDESLVFAGIDVISFVKKQLDVAPAFAIVLPAPTLENAPPDNHSSFTALPPPEPSPYGRNLLTRVQRFLI